MTDDINYVGQGYINILRSLKTSHRSVPDPFIIGYSVIVGQRQFVRIISQFPLYLVKAEDLWPLLYINVSIVSQTLQLH